MVSALVGISEHLVMTRLTILKNASTHDAFLVEVQIWSVANTMNSKPMTIAAVWLKFEEISARRRWGSCHADQR